MPGVEQRVSVRAARPIDREAVLVVMAARDQADFGDPSVSRALVTEIWRGARASLSEDVAVAELGHRVIGFAAVMRYGAWVSVDPAREGAGAGRSLLTFAEARARALGHQVHRQRTGAANQAARRLLGEAGYTEVRTAWQMVHDLRGLPAPTGPPTGVTLHRLDPAADAAALHAADTAAFAENPGYAPESLNDFRAEHIDTPLLDPQSSVVARRGSDVAGYAICQHLPGDVGFIDVLGVAAPERRRGLGAALLAHALHGFAAAGRHEGRLEVDSDNPHAQRLYERAGMAVRHGATIWERAAGGVDGAALRATDG